MSNKPWENQTPEEKLETLLKETERLNARLETAIDNFESYSEKIKVIIDEIQSRLQ